VVTDPYLPPQPYSEESEEPYDTLLTAPPLNNKQRQNLMAKLEGDYAQQLAICKKYAEAFTKFLFCNEKEWEAVEVIYFSTLFFEQT
jgi:hypothetical protein